MRNTVFLAGSVLLGACLWCTDVGAHALGDLVFCDDDGDGVFDPAKETGIAGVTVVRNCGGIIATTVTDAAGRYAFPHTPHTTCRISLDPSSPPIAGRPISTPRVGGPPLPTAEHSPFGGFGCGACPNAFVTTVVADGVFETAINNPCECVDPACPPTGPDPCFGPTPFVGYYGDDFGVVCSTSSTTTTSSTSTTTSTSTTSTTSSTTTTSTTTTTTTSTSTSTTTLPSCGDGHLQPPEHCDPPGSATCPPTSPGGAFLPCQLDCTCTTGCPPFPFLIRTSGKVGNDSRVTGSIGANDPGGHFHFGKQAFQSDGGTVAADDLGLGQGTSVANLLGNTLRLGPGAVVRGTTGVAVLPLTTPFCPIPDFGCDADAPLRVPRGGSVGPLPPGSYGALTILNGGTLVLAPGTFEFCSFKTARRTTLTVTGSALTTINVLGTLRLANASSLAPATGTPTPKINVAGSLVRVSRGSALEASLSAPNAMLTLGVGAKITGTFCVDLSRSDKAVTLICPAP